MLCANILRFVALPPPASAPAAASQADNGDRDDDDDRFTHAGDEENEEEEGERPRPVTRSPLEGLPPELVDRLLRSLVKHGALLPPTLAALHGCDPSVLDLSSCRGVSDAWLASFAHAPLTDLNLKGAVGVTDAGLGALQGLRHLRRADLSHCCQIRGDGLRGALGQSRGLSTLNLTGCVQLTDAGLEPLPRSAATLRALSLEGCRRLTDAACRGPLRQLQGLEVLSLNQCQGLSCDGLLACLGALPRLQQLDLGFLGPQAKVGPAVFGVLPPTLEALVLDQATELGNSGE